MNIEQAGKDFQARLEEFGIEFNQKVYGSNPTVEVIEDEQIPESID